LHDLLTQLFTADLSVLYRIVLVFVGAVESDVQRSDAGSWTTANMFTV